MENNQNTYNQRTFEKKRSVANYSEEKQRYETWFEKHI